MCQTGGQSTAGRYAFCGVLCGSSPRAHANQQPDGKKTVKSDEWQVASRQPQPRVHSPIPVAHAYPHTVAQMMACAAAIQEPVRPSSRCGQESPKGAI